ncbi:erythromycin esterase family protein [Ectobacillus ponti]|uniref:Erythromycin esterase family protein n=1 Tax=Ectobacillus ponti TaxID=2961894 RepID=A0AA41XBF2_9BACI|nr:erythromycin esterase family protein [Ectobacillus ponti]MCP8970593.1 erythromycin esterase family protein [Ectobacillus ponti]
MVWEVVEGIEKYAKRLDDRSNVDALLERAGQAKVVLLGEASHGTSEFYTTRAEITKRLIEEKGFTAVVVEGDWPSCQQVNQYIKRYEDAPATPEEAVKAFNRWPTWMWANEEMLELYRWMREHNDGRTDGTKIGFYGFDVYSLWESIDEVIRHLGKKSSADAEAARQVFECFATFNRNTESYAVSAGLLSEGCTDEAVKLLAEVRRHKHAYTTREEEALDLEVNALITANAEHYYRIMVRSDNESWNVRDRHMVEVLHHVMKFYGEDAKVIVWAHNTHVGDARATSMLEEGTVNVGQLVREQHAPEDVYIIGFGTYTGTVTASEEWGLNLERMHVPAARPGSWEELLHRTGPYDKLIMFNEENRPIFSDRIGHRAIGVVYRPRYERYNYVPSQVSHRYDAFIYLETTQALHPLSVPVVLV